MFKNLLIILLLISCQPNVEKRKEFLSPKTTDNAVYQEVEIFQVQKNEERYGKQKVVQYVIHLTNSKCDTSIIESNTIFYKGLYWAETIERDGKIIFILSAEEYETVKLN